MFSLLQIQYQLENERAILLFYIDKMAIVASQNVSSSNVNTGNWELVCSRKMHKTNNAFLQNTMNPF